MPAGILLLDQKLVGSSEKSLSFFACIQNKKGWGFVTFLLSKTIKASQ
jgi:hypothetical protein